MFQLHESKEIVMRGMKSQEEKKNNTHTKETVFTAGLKEEKKKKKTNFPEPKKLHKM